MTSSDSNLGDFIAQAHDATAQALTVNRSGSTDLSVSLDSAVAVKAQITGKHAEVSIARKKALSKISEAKAEIKRQQDALEAQMRELEASLRPQMAEMKKMEEVIDTINLYLGRDEAIEIVTEGSPAPAATPIVVRQETLYMDEESLLFADSDEFDFSRIDDFIDWLAADVKHADQVIPEKRGVVAIQPRRKEKRYGDTLSDAVYGVRNAHTWFLIRNGENLYIMTTDFEAGAKMVPSRDEFTSMFFRDGVQLEPGSQAWIRAEEVAGARERHYMKIALILQGLIDRTAVFHPLPAEKVSLLSPESYDIGHVILMADEDMAITSGRPDFETWLRSAQSSAREGSRVVFTSRHPDWPSHSTESHYYGHHERLSPSTAVMPHDGVYDLTKGSSSGTFKFLYERNETIYTRYESKTPSRRASAVLHVGDGNFIPLDAVSLEEVDYYLNSRTERQHYAKSIGILRTVREIKVAEQVAEAPFRQMLAERLITAGVSEDEADREVTTLVDWWKHGNKFERALSGDAGHEAKAARAILAEHARRVKAHAALEKNAGLADLLRTQHPDALLIARKKDGSWVVLDPQERRHSIREEWSKPRDPFTVMSTYTASGKPRETVQWHLPKSSSVSRWTVLHMSEAWGTWPRDVKESEYLTDSEVDEVIEGVRRATTGTLLYVSIQRVFGSWRGDIYTADVESELTAALREHSTVYGDRGVQVHNQSFSVSKDDGVSFRLYGHTASKVRLTHWIRSSFGHDRHASYQNGVMHDETSILALLAKSDMLAAQYNVLQGRRDLAQKAYNSLSKAWIDARTEEAHQRFVSDYAEELWEDHSKTLKIEDVFNNWWERDDYTPEKKISRAAARACKWLADTDLSLEGTVREIVERAIADGADITVDTTIESALWDVRTNLDTPTT